MPLIGCRRRWRNALIGIGVLTLAARPADAANCTITTTSLLFGTYNVFASAPLDTTGLLTYRCTGAKNIVITISPGQSGSFNRRILTGGSEALAYNLFRDASRTAIWGDGTSGTQAYTAPTVPNNVDVQVTIFGRVEPDQDVSAGTFSDSLSVTINF